LQEHFEKQIELHEDDDASTNFGVNGFGILAFAIKSKRVSRVNETKTKRLDDKTLDGLATITI